MPRFIITLFFACCLSIVFGNDSEESNKEYEKNLADCMKQFPKVTEATLKDMHKKDYKTEDKDIYCFVKCVGDKNGVLNEKGIIDIDKVMAQNKETKDKDKLKAAHEKCMEQTGGDPCETAYKQWRCLGDQIGWE